MAGLVLAVLELQVPWQFPSSFSLIQTHYHDLKAAELCTSFCWYSRSLWRNRCSCASDSTNNASCRVLPPWRQGNIDTSNSFALKSKLHAALSVFFHINDISVQKDCKRKQHIFNRCIQQKGLGITCQYLCPADHLYKKEMQLMRERKVTFCN